MSNLSNQTHSDRPSARPRVRLAPEQRVPQILDAALAEFSRRGFTATRMDDIARRCGLSKGGLYAHFDGKDAILTALLDRAQRRIDWDEMPPPAIQTSTRATAEWIVERLEQTLLTPDNLAILRILIPERDRVPLRADEWRRGIIQMRAGPVAVLIGKRLAASGRSDSVLARHPWLALSPVIHVLLWQTIFGDASSPDPGWRQAHIDMLCELLG